jgi:uncharacterized membrane protein
MKHLFCGLMALGLLVGLAADAKAQPTYSFTTLDWRWANGINASGQIVGYYYDAADRIYGFLLDKGSYTTLDVPGATNTIAYGINDSGQIVGYYPDPTYGFPVSHGFLFDQGSYTLLTVPDLSGSTAGTFPTGINAMGQIVGGRWHCTGRRQGDGRNARHRQEPVSVPAALLLMRRQILFPYSANRSTGFSSFCNLPLWQIPELFSEGRSQRNGSWWPSF